MDAVKRGASWCLVGLLWLFHGLPLGLQARLGVALGRLLHAVAGSRRRVALRNVELCLPHWPLGQRQALVRRHFEWLARSLLERPLLWWAPPERLKRLIRVAGDIGLAERSERPVMWLTPHFVALETVGTASQLLQSKPATSLYQPQSNAVFEQVLLQGRTRFGHGVLRSRHHQALALLKDIRRGHVFINLPDMDFGPRDSAFVPFFGVPAATLLAPARLARSLNMVVQPVVARMRPGGEGYEVEFMPPWPDHWLEGGDEAATRHMNAWIEAQVLACPEQYLWVHKRFKTRPEGEPSLYG